MKGLFNSLDRESIIQRFIVVAIFFLLFTFLILPLSVLFIRAFQDNKGQLIWLSQFATYFSSPNMIRSLFNSIYISFFSMIISVSLAFIMAYCISRKNIPFKKSIQFIAMLPLFAPTMLLGVCLIYLFGNQGLLTKLGMVIPLYGKVGIIIAESIFCFPVALMILIIAFSSADYRYYEAAEVMGASPLKKLITITLPNVKYGLISAMFVCFTYSFTDFGAPAIVGGNYNVLATDIYKQVIGQQNFNMGAVVGIIMMIPAVVSFFVDRYATSKQGATLNAKSTSYIIKPHFPSDAAAITYCSLISTLLILFFAICLFASLVTMWPYNLDLTLSHYDFKKALGDGGNFILFNSIFVAGLTAIIGTILAFLAAYAVEKVQVMPKIRRGIYFLSIAPMAIPGTVVGLSFVLFFNPRFFSIPFTQYSLVNAGNILYGTYAILVVANIIHYFSVPFVTASTALKKLDKDFEVVSRSLNVPFYRTLRKITLPLCKSAIFEMMVFYFVNSMITISAVVFLYTPLTKLTSISILNMRDAGDIAEAAAMSMFLFFINLGIRLVYEILRARQASSRT